MIIGCPECETRFVVAPQAIGKDGRMVRCSRCSKTWFQEAPDEDLEIVPEKVIEGEEKTLAHEKEGSKPASGTGEKIKSNVPVVVKKKSFGALIGWGIAATVLAGVVASLYYLRTPLENRFEVAETFYQKWDAFVADQGQFEPQATPEPAEALPHLSTFLTLSNNSNVSFDNGISTLSIEGEVRNSADFDIDLPNVNVVIKNVVGATVFSTIHTLEQAVVAANEILHFSITVSDIPADSAEVEISLMWDDTP